MRNYQSPKSPRKLSLPKAWLAFCTAPETAHDELGRHLDVLLKSRLPDGCCQGVMNGLEDEIRQEAYLLLVRRYLAGNPALFEATAAHDEDEIAEQIERSARASLTAVKRTMKKATLQRARAHDDDADIDAVCGTDHAANRSSIWGLPFELQKALVFLVLQRAAKENLLPPRSVSVATDMLENEMTQSDLARTRGVSRQSIHQHLGRVRAVLEREISATEFPMTAPGEDAR